MKSISVTQARKDLGDIFGEVLFHKERILLTNHKKRVAIVPIEDLELLQALENEKLARDFREASADEERNAEIELWDTTIGDGLNEANSY